MAGPETQEGPVFNNCAKFMGKCKPVERGSDQLEYYIRSDQAGEDKPGKKGKTENL